MGRLSTKTKDADARIGRAIRTQRQVKGASRESLSKKIGVSPQQIQKYESGKNRVSVSTLCMIADALELQQDYLFFKVTHDAKR